MSRKKLLLVGVAILGVFSAVGLLATNFQIYEVTTGNYADAKWPGSSPNITWLLNFTSTPANVVENDGVTTSDSLVAAFNTWKGATYNGSAVSTIGFTAGTPSASLPQGPATDCQNVIGFDDTTSGDLPTGGHRLRLDLDGQYSGRLVGHLHLWLRNTKPHLRHLRWSLHR